MTHCSTCGEKLSRCDCGGSGRGIIIMPFVTMSRFYPCRKDKEGRLGVARKPGLTYCDPHLRDGRICEESLCFASHEEAKDWIAKNNWFREGNIVCGVLVHTTKERWPGSEEEFVPLRQTTAF